MRKVGGQKNKFEHKLKRWTMSLNLEDMNIIDERPGWCLSPMESEDVTTSSRDREGVIRPGTVTRRDRRHHIVIP